jgi:hypothetical protein
VEKISTASQAKLVEMLGRLVSRGMIMSGQTVSETAKIGDDRIRSMVDAKLETVMESDGFTAFLSTKLEPPLSLMSFSTLALGGCIRLSEYHRGDQNSESR